MVLQKVKFTKSGDDNTMLGPFLAFMTDKNSESTLIKNELKYFPMSEDNTYIAEPNLEASPLIRFSKGLV